MGDVTLSSSAVLAVTGLLACLASAIGVLFWRLDDSRQSQIAQAQTDADDKVEREREITDKMMPAVEENTRTLKRWIEIQEAIWERERRMEYRELPPGPPTTRRRSERDPGA